MTTRHQKTISPFNGEECELCNGAGALPDVAVCPVCDGEGMVRAVPKPISRKQEKATQRRYDAAWVTDIRHKVVLRDQGCRACHDSGQDPAGAGLRMQMHEIVYRSQTRGKPMRERVNTANCILLCDRCHTAIHAKQLAVHVMDPEVGADGKLLFKRFTPDVQSQPEGVP